MSDKWLVVTLPNDQLIYSATGSYWTFREIEMWAGRNPNLAKSCKYYRLGLPFVASKISNGSIILQQTFQGATNVCDT